MCYLIFTDRRERKRRITQKRVESEKNVAFSLSSTVDLQGNGGKKKSNLF